MHDDLMELSNNMDRGRKHWKQTGMTYERKTSDAELLVEKVKDFRYNRYVRAILTPCRLKSSTTPPQKSTIE